MSTPGAVMSGLIRSGTWLFGPRDENAAMISPLLASMSCTVPWIAPRWFVSPLFSQALSAMPSLYVMWTPGIAYASPISSSPLDAALTKIMPPPPAAWTTSAFSTRAFTPRSQMTIWPAKTLPPQMPGSHNALP